MMTDHYDVVHLDEKYFQYFSGSSRQVRVYPDLIGEYTLPEQHFNHKSFVPKVMFLMAVARPRPGYGFDGKIMLRSFVQHEVAKRSDSRTGTKKGVTKLSTPLTVDGKLFEAAMLGRREFEEHRSIFQEIAVHMP